MSTRRKLMDGEYKSKCKVFLFPILGERLAHVVRDHSYLIDVNYDDDKIVLIFDNIDDVPLKEDLFKLKMNSLCIDSYLDDDEKEIVLRFKVPKERKIDFDSFLRGEYSRFTAPFKEQLEWFHGKTRGSGKSKKTNLPIVHVYDALYPLQKTRVDMAKELNIKVDLIDEVLDPPNLEKEKYKTIKELEYGNK